MRECYRCNNDITRPVESKSNYVRGHDMVCDEEQTQIVALKHTDETRTIRDKIQEFHEMNTTQANIVLGRLDTAYLKAENDDGVIFDYTDLSEDDFRSVGVNRPTPPETDPEVVRTVEKTMTVERQKAGLVCDDCLEDDDEIIW